MFKEVGALLQGHFILTSGRHSDQYLNKDAVYPHTAAISELCRHIAIARFTRMGNVKTVVAPEKGGIVLTQWTAHYLSILVRYEVVAAYAEKTSEGGFAFNRGYDRLVQGRQVFVVEDVITTGGSVQAVIKSVKVLGGKVVGVGVLCNRSDMNAEELAQKLQVPWVYAVTTIPMITWPQDECPLCKDNVSIDTQVGKGAEFLAQQAG